MGIYFAWIRLLRRLVMKIFGLGKKRLSFKASSASLPTVLDPLDFLSAEPTGVGSRIAFDQIHAAIHESLTDCEKGIQLILEQLSPDGNISDRVILEANNQIRNELSRAISIAGQKRNGLIDEVHRRLETIYIQSLIQYPHQDPEVRKWDSLGPRAVIRELPPVTEYTFADLAQGGSDRDKRLRKWEVETDQWLDCLALNHTGEVIKKLDEYLKENGIDTLIYTGFAADMCVLNSEGGGSAMLSRGYRCILMRDGTVGVERPDTFEEKLATRYGIHIFEWKLGYSTTYADFMSAAKVAD